MATPMLILDGTLATVERNSWRPCEIRTTPMASTRYAATSYESFGVNVKRAPLRMFQLDHNAASVVARSDGDDRAEAVLPVGLVPDDLDDVLPSSVEIDG